MHLRTLTKENKLNREKGINRIIDSFRTKERMVWKKTFYLLNMNFDSDGGIFQGNIEHSVEFRYQKQNPERDEADFFENAPRRSEARQNPMRRRRIKKFCLVSGSDQK